MTILLAILETLVRLVLPARGLHAAPRGAADLFQADEVRERVPAPRTTRVQADGNGADRVPVPWTPIVQAENVNPQAELVRPYYVAYERAAANERAEVAR